jgi:DDE domain
MFVRIGGKVMYLWRAVDAEGEVLEVLVQATQAAVPDRASGATKPKTEPPTADVAPLSATFYNKICQKRN